MAKCPECQMTYVRGLAGDERVHSAHHDQVVNGFATPPSKNDRVLWADEERRITLVTERSPIEQRKRAEKVASLANLETRYTGGVYYAAEPANEENVQFLLYHVGTRVLGLIVLERKGEIWRCQWQGGNEPLCEELHGHEPMWSIVFVWVHKKYRRQGVARRLFKEASQFLETGEQGMGWYTPFTKEGEAFVKNLNPVEFYVVK